jgi:hypothetical protein
LATKEFKLDMLSADILARLIAVQGIDNYVENGRLNGQCQRPPPAISLIIYNISTSNAHRSIMRHRTLKLSDKGAPAPADLSPIPDSGSLTTSPSATLPSVLTCESICRSTKLHLLRSRQENEVAQVVAAVQVSARSYLRSSSQQLAAAEGWGEGTPLASVDVVRRYLSRNPVTKPAACPPNMGTRVQY